MNPNFILTAEEHQIVCDIVKRSRQLWPSIDGGSLEMDIAATHNQVCRLRLADLLAADDFNFAHDVLGIYHNLNRSNIMLEDCFWPRFASGVTE